MHLLLLLLVLVLGHANKPVQEQSSRNVDNNVHHSDTKVPPSVLVARADSLEERVGGLDGAESTVRCRVGVEDVATSLVGELLEIFSAGCTVERLHDRVLVGRARNLRVSYTRRQNRRDEIRKRRYSIHPDPEAGHVIGRGQDTTEEQAHHEDDVGKITACLSSVGDGDTHVGKGTREDEELPEEKPHESTALGSLASCFGVLLEADWVIDADEHEDGHETVPGDLGEDLGEHEDFPAVGLGGAFADFVEGALGDKVRHLVMLVSVGGEGSESRLTCI